MYWPAAALATVAFAALFHLIGAIFRRPVVVGLVYVFFFEALVGSLPGSLKLLSLTFYARSLMYNEAAAAGLPGRDAASVSQAVSSTTAWAVLASATVGLTCAGHVAVRPVGVPGRRVRIGSVDVLVHHRHCPCPAAPRVPRRRRRHRRRSRARAG